LQGANYNDGVFVVRYAALTALAIWVGGMILLLAQTTLGDVFARFHLVAMLCGVIVFICLFAMKFIGPPPHAFVIRAGLAFAMTAIALYLNAFQQSRSLLLLNIALGLVLLGWYARE
jgi:hypothetical protein